MLPSVRPIRPVSPEGKVTETSNLVEILPFACVTDIFHFGTERSKWGLDWMKFQVDVDLAATQFTDNKCGCGHDDNGFFKVG